MLDRIRAQLRSLLLRRRLEREMREEMDAHLDQASELLIARGMAPEEARRQALREFGNVGWLEERARDARGSRWIGELVADGRFAVRHLARNPGVTLVMLVVLTVGMCLSTLLFSFVHAYAERPPTGVERQDDLVRIRGSQAAGQDRGVRPLSEEEFREYEGMTSHFAAVAGWTNARAVVDAGTTPDRIGLDGRVAFVSDGFFQLLGVQPLLGAGLPSGAAARAAGPVAVIGYDVWERMFARSPGAIGSSLTLNGVAVTVVGVAPGRLAIGVTVESSGFSLWMPLADRELVRPEAESGMRAIARLRPGVDLAAASAAVARVPARMATQDDSLRALDAESEVVPLLSANGDPMFERDVRRMSLSVGLLGLLVLVITCTNVSALLTGLAAARRQEIAVRLSLGAGRTRIIRQLLTESALLATLAAASALGLVWAVLRAVTAYVPALPFQLSVTGPATTFTFAVALAVGVVFGLSPALHATRLALAGALRDSTATIAAPRGGLQRGLVVTQIASTQPLIVVIAALLVFLMQDFEQQMVGRTDLADRIVFVGLARPLPGGFVERASADAEYRDALARLFEGVRETPGVEDVVVDWRFARELGAYVASESAGAATAGRSPVSIRADRAAPGYFRTMGIRLVRGREFEPADLEATGSVERPAIIGGELARLAFGASDPIGRRLTPAADSATTQPALVVVGVVDHPLDRNRRVGQDHWIYLPPDTARGPAGMFARTTGNAEALVPALRALARETAPAMIPRVRAQSEIDADVRQEYRQIAAAVSTAGGLALLLSAIGLYAVVAFSVGHRTAEIAVRIAVGASRGRIARRFIMDAVKLSAVGVAIGMPISLIGLRALRGIEDLPFVPLPPVTALAAIAVAVVTIAAAWIPAQRAAAVDPAVTLRSG